MFIETFIKNKDKQDTHTNQAYRMLPLQHPGSKLL